MHGLPPRLLGEGRDDGGRLEEREASFCSAHSARRSLKILELCRMSTGKERWKKRVWMSLVMTDA